MNDLRPCADTQHCPSVDIELRLKQASVIQSKTIDHPLYTTFFETKISMVIHYKLKQQRNWRSYQPLLRRLASALSLLELMTAHLVRILQDLLFKKFEWEFPFLSGPKIEYYHWPIENHPCRT